jgi:hypothetical protein
LDQAGTREKAAATVVGAAAFLGVDTGERGDDLLDHAVDENTLAPDRR